MLCDHLAATRFQLDDVSACCEVSVAGQVQGVSPYGCKIIQKVVDESLLNSCKRGSS